MFETSVVRVQARRTQRRYGLFTLSVVVHAAIIVSIVGASLASVTMPDNAPNQMTIPVFDHLPPALGTPDAKPAPPRPKPAQPQAQPQAPRNPAPQTVVAPSVIPPTTEVAAASTSTADSDAASNDSGNGEQQGVPWGTKEGVGVDAPPVTETVAPSMPIRVVGEVKPPVVLRRVQPEYPRAAMFARLNGFVIVECVIDRAGTVRDARITQSSSKLFEQAALDAVHQWQFSPGTLHGQPVDVIFALTVRFEINR